jgi:hypothetical protein
MEMSLFEVFKFITIIVGIVGIYYKMDKRLLMVEHKIDTTNDIVSKITEVKVIKD